MAEAQGEPLFIKKERKHPYYHHALDYLQPALPNYKSLMFYVHECSASPG